MRANSFNTGISSEYLILSKLYRLDLEAYISQGNKKSIDIRVVNNNGVTLTIDVKSVRGYSSLVVNNVEQLETHFIVFVIYNNKFGEINIPPDIFIVPSQDICEPLVSVFKKEKRVMKGKLTNYKDNWNLITQFQLNKNKNEYGQNIINDYNIVLKLRKLNYSRNEICRKLSIDDNGMIDLEAAYNEITGG